jgi:DNA-binding response OmpR family regulator
VLITGAPNDALRTRAAELGADALLVKPVGRDELMAAVFGPVFPADP